MKDFLSSLTERDIYVALEEEDLSVTFPESGMDMKILEEIKSRKKSIVEYLKHHNGNELEVIPVLGKAKSYPLSDGQRRLWILSQFEGGGVAYNIPTSINLGRDIHIESFKRAINATIDRHEILRTVFREDESGEIRQWIFERSDLGFTIDYQDYSKEANKHEKTEAYMASDAYQAFDLSKGPLLRAALLRIGDEEYVFYFNIHHIISDGWSMGVLSNDVFRYYEAFKAGKEPELKQLRIQYKDYSAWHLAQLNGEPFKAHREFWLDMLTGELPLLDLPTSKKRPKAKTFNGHSLVTCLDKATTTKLKRYTLEHRGSLFIGLLASWNVLMYRYTSQKDIITGTAVAARSLAELEDQIGFYANTLALRNEINPEESFDEFYNRLKEQTLMCYTHQLYPFNVLVEDLNLRRDTSRNAVFDVMLLLQSKGEGTNELELPQNELQQIVDQGYRVSKFDIEITAQDMGDHLSLNVLFNPDVYEKEMIERLIVHYKQLLTALLHTPKEKISQIEYLSAEEKHKLLMTFNDTTVVYPKDKTIVDMFEEQVAKTPDNIAVVFEHRELTYRELNEQSNQLAHYLRKNYDIQPDDLVGIKQERSEWVILSILGVLKAGGAYVPIDPEYPQERIAYIEADTHCKGCLDEAALNKFKESREHYSKEPVRSGAKSDNLIYVIYTSGSTGEPKGVMLEHNGVVNRMCWMKRDLEVKETDVFLQKTPLTFDVSVWELFLPLICGSKLVFAKPDGHKDPDYLDKIAASQKISIMHFVPSMLSAALDTIKWDRLESLRHVVCSGEALPKRIEESFKERARFSSLHNYYGPTEASIDVTAINLSEYPTEGYEVPIGKPVDNTHIYIVNEKNSLQPVGVLGEILIGGDQVARGYLNKEAMTTEKFIVSPFKDGERIYKTGDLGRWKPDGNIEFIGRSDDQVKIRGHRIEIGEIEHALLSHDEIDQAVVLVKKNKSAENELVAYFTSRVEHNKSDLIAYLKDKLPAYMLPLYFVKLDTLPVTSNGKTDKKSLPDPEGLELSTGVEYVAPSTAVEKKLVEIWQDILGIERVGIEDNFFTLGGHSLSALQMAGQINKRLGAAISPSILFELFTIKDISNKIQQMNAWTSYFEPDYKTTTKPKHIKIAATGGSDNLQKLFFCAPLGGILPSTSIIGIMDMAVYLENEVSFYSIQAPAIKPEINELIESGREVNTENIEFDPKRLGEIADQAVDEILLVDKEGPYSIGGFCTGCVLASEIARKLKSRNKEIKNLILIDPSLWVQQISKDDIILNYKQEEIVWFIAKDLAWSSNLMDMDELTQRLQNHAVDEAGVWDICREYLEQIQLFPFTVKSEELKQAFQNKFYNDLILYSFFANFNYYWLSLSIERTLILSVDDIAAIFEKETLEKNVFNGEVYIELIPGTHNSLFRDEYLTKWAKMIPDFLNKRA
ncbi:MAG: amino acid adenylation domain-containing protein [Bacteroidetes bacterium]|nr:amino acid adenylation domain-containing protein [Bacteroidota bacterium]